MQKRLVPSVLSQHKADERLYFKNRKLALLNMNKNTLHVLLIVNWVTFIWFIPWETYNILFYSPSDVVDRLNWQIRIHPYKRTLIVVEQTYTHSQLCRIDLDFNGYYTRFLKEKENKRQVKTHFQTKTTTASANKMDIAITLYPTNTEQGYHNDKT